MISEIKTTWFDNDAYISRDDEKRWLSFSIQFGSPDINNQLPEVIDTCASIVFNNNYPRFTRSIISMSIIYTCPILNLDQLCHHPLYWIITGQVLHSNCSIGFQFSSLFILFFWIVKNCTYWTWINYYFSRYLIWNIRLYLSSRFLKVSTFAVGCILINYTPLFCYIKI